MLAAKLQDKITIYNQSFTNSFGDLLPTKAKLIDIYATKTVKTTTNEEGVVIELTNFYFRYYPNINYDSIIESDGSTYNIISINKIGRNEALSIDAIRQVNNN